MKKPMKTLASVILLLVLFCNISISQTTGNQDEEIILRTFGLGFDYKPNLYNDLWYFYGYPNQFLVTLNIKDIVRIEPRIGFTFTSHKYDNTWDEVSGYIAGIGIYGLKNKNPVLFRYGFEYLHFMRTYEADNAVRNRRVRKGNGIGPSIGVEYLFRKHFSLGTGFSVIYSKVEVDDGVSKDESKDWSTITGLQFRFYF